MGTHRRLLVLVVVFTCTGIARAQEAPTQLRLTPAEMEAFLLKASINHRRDAGAGVTGSSRVTLSDGRITHDAHVQTVDIARGVFDAGGDVGLHRCVTEIQREPDA